MGKILILISLVTYATLIFKGLQWLLSDDEYDTGETFINPYINNVSISEPVSLTEQLRRKDQDSPARTKQGKEVKLW